MEKEPEIDVIFLQKRIKELRETIRWAELENREYSLKCLTLEYQKILRDLRKAEII